MQGRKICYTYRSTYCTLKKRAFIIYFFTDLDNTLIYSHRHKYDGNLVWVEKINEKDQSFMTYEAYSFFSTQNLMDVIPVTTRSFSQYERLSELANKMHWNKALICNGAVLLEDGREDENWLYESQKISAAEIPILDRLYSAVKNIVGEDSVVNMYDLMFYVKSDDPDMIYSILSERADKQVMVLKDSRKVYCIPSSLNKGKAIERYILRFGKKISIAAGDSPFDIPMLKKADFGFYTEEIRQDCEADANGILCRGFFSDDICSQLRKLYRDGVSFE